MISFVPRGAIFDIDDTLLNNYPEGDGGLGLHERARMLAIREAGAKYGIPKLAETTAEHNRHVIRRAREHSVEGGVWQLLHELGLVTSPIIDHKDSLLREIVQRKHELYAPVLAEHGAPLPHAVPFVRAMHGLTDGHVAIASGARRSDVETFLAAALLGEYFLPTRIYARDDFEYAKPDPQSFELAFASFGLPDEARGEVVAFEDDPKGIAAAKAAGLFACAITSRYTLAALQEQQYPPDFISDSYADFAHAFRVTL